MEEAVEGPVVVLGSKPGTELPEIRASFVITANSAVELGLLYRERYGSKIIAMMNGRALGDTTYLQDSLKKSRPDKIILSGGDKDTLTSLIEHDLACSGVPVEMLSPRDSYQLMKDTLGWRIVLVVLEHLRLRGVIYVARYVLRDLLGKRYMQWMSRSTGMNAIFYALKQFPQTEVIAAGIGLKSGEHFTKKGNFTEKTAAGDRITMRHWLPDKRPRLFTTEPTLVRIGNVPKWNGSLFYENTYHER